MGHVSASAMERSIRRSSRPLIVSEYRHEMSPVQKSFIPLASRSLARKSASALLSVLSAVDALRSLEARRLERKPGMATAETTMPTTPNTIAARHQDCMGASDSVYPMNGEHGIGSRSALDRW